MAGESRQMLKQAVDAFLEGNADKARATMVIADQVERSFVQIIVSLQGPVKSYVEQIPFHTVALEWEVTRPGSAPPDRRILSREIALQVSNLMTVLRGQEAN